MIEARKPGDMLPYGANLIDTGLGHYRDTGCREDDYAPRLPSCLECPLDECRYDDPKGFLKWVKQQEDMKVVEVVQRSSLGEAAQELGVDERTIFRVLKRQGYCSKGHLKRGENAEVYHHPDGNNYIRCRKCRRQNHQKYARNKREESKEE